MRLRWHNDKGGRYKADQKTHDRYGCPLISISSRPLDEKVWQKVLKVIRTPDAIAEELESRVSGDSAKNELKDAIARVKKLERKAVNLFLSLEDVESAADRRDILARRAEINAEREQAELDRQSIAARATQVDAWRESFDQLVAEIYAQAAEIDSYNLDQKRATLQKLQVKVYISPSGGEDRERVEIGISPPPPDPNELYDGAGLGGWDDINPANDWDNVSDEDLARLGYYPEDNDEWPEELDENRRSSHTERDERVPTGGADSKRSLT